MKNPFFPGYIKATNIFIMKASLHKILKKVEAVQLGLLRVESNEKKFLMQTRAGTNQESLNCILQSEVCDLSLLEKNVSLIQKDKQDYLYISCKVKEEIRQNMTIVVSMTILKACWFIRKSKGSVCWLKEKYVYEALEDINMAS